MIAWAVEWHSRDRLDGDQRHLVRTRPDLQAEPFGWRIPQAVRVAVTALGLDPRRGVYAVEVAP